MIGQTISHYKILEKIGEGGMGVVYKAEDTKLHRTVALKFLRPDAVENRELKARFLNEAEAAAALTHPNICVVYEIDEADEKSFIAMEYVEGDSLAQKIRKRPLPLDDALSIVTQVADGIQAAHEKGVVHRDIKPANIMLDSSGRAKVMDFGLAHLEEATRITKTGTVIGTPAYMSPEQIRGEEADHRTDIWSLGVVIYEMIAGRLPFPGDVAEAISHAVIHESPEPLTALRAGVPIELDWIVGKCLAKEPGQRYQHPDELRVDLNGLRRKLKSGSASAVTTPLTTSTPKPAQPQSLKRWLWAAVAALVVSVTAVVGLWVTRPEPGPAIPYRRFALGSGRKAVISPNGRYVAYIANRKLMVRDLERQEAEVIEDVGANNAHLAWSPESDFIAYPSGSQLKRVSRSGGAASRICNRMSSSMVGVSWSPDGESIVYSSWRGGPRRLSIVPAEGGVPRLLFDRSPTEADRNDVFPHFTSPVNGRVLLYTKQVGQESWIQAHDLETGSETTVCQGSRPAYSPTGHVIYQNGGRLWAISFSSQKLEATGEPFELAEGGQHPSVSADGTLVYWEGSEDVARKLEQWDRSGALLRTIGQPQEGISWPVVSPSGRRVAVRAGGDLWIHDVDRPLRSRLTTNLANDCCSAWSPSGREMAFSSDRAGSWDIYIMPTDGSQGAEAVTDGPFAENVSDWSADGRYIVYYTYAPSEEQTGADLLYLEKGPDGSFKPNSFLRTAFDEIAARLSPDGRFIAYLSNETGRPEVFVREFPDGKGKVQVSTTGGAQPKWSRETGELFYFGKGGVVAVEYRLDPAFRVEGEELLFQLPIDSGTQYAVAPDGRSFFVGQPEGESKEPVIHVVQNWYAEFEDRQ